MMPILARAQAGNADVLGSVTDPSGAVIPDATVTVHNLGTAVDRVLSSNSRGEYTASLLPNGHYSLKVEAKGFKTFTVSSFTLDTGDRLRMDAKMEPGAVTEEVKVEASVEAALQTDSSTVTSTIDEKSTQDLPLNNRNFASALTLMPGIVLNASSTGSGGFSVTDRRPTAEVQVNGQLPAYNNNLIDGFDNNERNNGLTGVRPSIDGIAEMAVDTSVFRAEVGRAGGGAINLITKSGTSQFHGSLFEYLRNEDLNASDPVVRVNPLYRQNIFGGSIGGPVPIWKLKGKTFFFFDYEQTRLLKGQSALTSVPTSYELSNPGDFSDIDVCYNCSGSGGGAPPPPPPPPGGPATPSGNQTHGPNLVTGVGIFNPALNGGTGGFTDSSNATPFTIPQVAKNLWALIPQPNATSGVLTCYDTDPDTGQCAPNETPLNNYASASPTTQNGKTWSLRIDENFSAKDQFFARYANNPYYTYFAGIFPEVTAAAISKGIYTAAATPFIGFFPGGNNNNFPGPSNTNSKSLQLDWVHIFKPNLILDLKGAGEQISVVTEPLNYKIGAAAKLGMNNVYIPSVPSTDTLPIWDLGTIQLGASNSVPSVSVNDNFQYSGALTYTHGSHTFKAGVGLIRRQLKDFNNQEGGGGFPVNGNTAPYTNFGQFLTGYSTVELRSITLVAPYFHTWEESGYVQDDWRVNSKLTLNLGLRYDIFTPWTEAHGHSSNFDLATESYILQSKDPNINCNSCEYSSTLGVKTNHNDISPRVGFAYEVTPKTVVRGGYGMSWYPLEVGSSAAGTSPSNMIGLPNAPYTYIYVYTPGTVGYQAPNWGGTQGAVLPGGCTEAASCTLAAAATNVDNTAYDASVAGITNAYGFKNNSMATTINIRPKNSRAIMVQQLNLTVQRQIGDYSVTAGYVGVLSNGLGRGINLNDPAPGCGPNPTDQNPCPAQPWVYGVGGQYDGTSKMMPYVQGIGYTYNGSNGNYHSLQLIASRQFKQGLRVNANYTFAHAMDDTAPGASAQWVQNPKYDYGNAASDQRQRFNGVVTYTMPYGNNAQGLKRLLVGGWEGTGIVNWNTGSAFDMEDQVHGGQTPPINVPGLSGDRPNYLPSVGWKLKHPNATNWFNTAAFVNQTTGTAGNEKKNMMHGPNFINSDLSLLKNFTVTENTKFQFRAEAFNFANITNWGNPNANIGSSATISSIAGNPRQIQIALKFLF
jgi:hypothetical protein